MKIYMAILSGLFLSSCCVATLDTPKKYDIYLSNIGEQEVFEYVKYLAKQSSYKDHKVLVINKDYAEITYTSKLAPEEVYKKTSQYFKYEYPVKLNSNVIKVEGIKNEIH